MICGNCENANLENASFCSSCGAKLGGLASSPTLSEHTAANSSSGSPAINAISEADKITCVVSASQSGSGGSTTFAGGHHDPLIGRTIENKYRIDLTLGSGGMGAVYRATRLVIGDEVAIKILHSKQNDPNAGERFRREAQAAARLKHQNAVSIYDFGVTDDALQYLVMELVEGQSLRRIIKEQGPLTPSASAEIINQVCAALDEAHRHNIIHRDIKPDNIIVNLSANRLRVKVLDFGIAKLRDDTSGNLTQTGSILGTPHYMSPEQCLGEELDSRSDIYSLGVVAYEMLTGLLPFNSPSFSGVVVQHVTQEPAPLRLLSPAISSAVEFAVLNALEKKRDARPQTAEDFAEKLSSAIADKTRAASSDMRNFAPVHRNQETSPQTQPTVVLARRSPTNPSGVDPAIVSRSAQRSSFGYIGVAVAALLLGGVFVWLVRSGANGNATNSNAQLSRTTPLNIAAKASSVRLPIQTNTYDAANAIDGRPNTAWVEGVNGPGIGEWIQFNFDREIILHRIIVQPGYFKSPSIWKANNRLAAVTAELSDGSSRQLAFSDLMEGQQIDLGALRTNWVRFVIRSAYHGTNPGPYDDTGLSEVTFEWEPKN